MENDLKPILLTGAGGYLGRQVLGKLQARCLPCVPTSLSGAIGEPCDLRDVESVVALLDRTNPAAVIHCAAMVPKSMGAYDDNQAAEASASMLRNLAENAGCRIVLASSMTVYSAASHFPVGEDDVMEPESGYAMGKWMAEQTLLSRNIPGDVALRLPGLFGLPRRSGLLYNAAKTFVTRQRFELTAPTELWAAMAVEDAAEYLVRAAVIPAARPSVVNIGYEGEFNVLSAVAQIAACCQANWTPPTIKVTQFSMCLQRLASRYGILTVTFRQRLEAFVDAVRNDLGMESARGIYAD